MMTCEWSCFPERDSSSSSLCAVIFIWLCRICGMATALGMWGISVETWYNGHLLGIYLLCIALIMSFLEVVFLMNYFIELYKSETPPACRKVWSGILWLDDWKKGLLYLFVSPACFINPTVLRLAVIGGSTMMLTGLLYMFKTFITRYQAANWHNSPASKHSPIKTYNRFDELPDDAEDDIEELGNDHEIVIQDRRPIVTVADQSEILEV